MKRSQRQERERKRKQNKGIRRKLGGTIDTKKDHTKRDFKPLASVYQAAVSNSNKGLVEH